MKGVSFTEEIVPGIDSYWVSSWRSWDVGSRYELLKHLGKGSYGQVTMAKDR